MLLSLYIYKCYSNKPSEQILYRRMNIATKRNVTRNRLTSFAKELEKTIFHLRNYLVSVNLDRM